MKEPKPFPTWPNWVMDVTHEKPPFCFCPIEDDGSIVLGMNLIADRCPGELVGIFHEGGQDDVENWEKKHPTWHKKYRRVNEGVK